MHLCDEILRLARQGDAISVCEVRELIKLTTRMFKQLMIDHGHDGRDVTRVTTKFRDARPTFSALEGIFIDSSRETTAWIRRQSKKSLAIRS